MIKIGFSYSLPVCLLLASPLAFAADQIERPASQLMVPNEISSPVGRGETSKSKLVPIVRPVKGPDASFKGPSADVKMKLANPVPTRNVATSQRTLLPTKPASGSKGTPGKVTSPVATSKNKKAPARIAQADDASAQVPPMSSGDDPWDSASQRFDQNDPAASVTQGVRVEDIIEATAEYRYSGARKKNPFIPEVIMGRAPQQKELNPNDVEIPIINPLQSFNVSQLAVIGVWEGDDGVWKALIQTPTNQGIETKLGDPAGNSGGRIMSITPESVVVREFSVRADGTREYRDIPLYMGSDKPVSETSNVGGRLILRPGSSTPEIEPPAGGSIKPLPPVSVAPTASNGTLKTVVPAAELAPPVYQYSDSPADASGAAPEYSGPPPMGSLPASDIETNGGSK